MKVVITIFAFNEIKAIHRYYEKRASKSVADKLTDRIFEAIESLEYAAHAGSIESLLKQFHLSSRIGIRECLVLFNIPCSIFAVPATYCRSWKNN